MTRDRHPIRGFFAGLLVGLGVVIMLVIYAKAAYTTPWPLLGIVGAFAVVGVLVGLFGPTRGKRAAGPTGPAVPPASGGSDGSSSPDTATA